MTALIRSWIHRVAPLVEKIIEIVSKRVLGNVGILPLLSAVAAFSVLALTSALKQAALGALLVFGIIGIAEHLYRQANAKHVKLMKRLDARRTYDTETFLKLADRIYGVRGWKPEYEDITVGGFIYRIVSADKPVPMKAISGPLCPGCGKNLTVSVAWFFPCLMRVDCLCGYRRSRFADPEKLYQKVRNYFNLPR